jgi:hypothetical protein
MTVPVAQLMPWLDGQHEPSGSFAQRPVSKAAASRCELYIVTLCAECCCC